MAAQVLSPWEETTWVAAEVEEVFCRAATEGVLGTTCGHDCVTGMRWGLPGRWTWPVPLPGSGGAVLVTGGPGRGGLVLSGWAWASSSTLTGKGTELPRAASSAGVEQLLWGSWGLRRVLAGWTRTQDMAKEELQFQGCFCSCSCPAVALVAVSVCKSVQLMPGTLLGYFFALAHARGMWKKPTCSPKISSGVDFLCFLCHTGSTWAGL